MPSSAVVRIRARLLVGAAFAVVFATLLVQSAGAVSANLVVSQVYGGGGNTGAPFNADFIEVFNRGSSPASLSGMSLQYASATGTGNFGANAGQLTELPDVTLPPGGYFLVQQSSGANGEPLPTPDLIDPTPIAMSGTAGKVALVTGATSLGCNGGSSPCPPDALARIVDLVGYGNANFFEGPTAAPTLSNTTAALRLSGGCVDTDSNGADFSAGAPTPRASGTPDPCDGDAAPAVAARTPTAGAADVDPASNVTITFSEPVNVTGDWFSISCTESGIHAAEVSGGSTTLTLNPGSGFTAGETCTVTIVAAQVSDQDTDDPPDTMAGNDVFSFTIVRAGGCAAPPTHQIAQVQGSGAATPLAGQQVRVEGIVTGDFQGPGQLSGFFFQDSTPDGNPATSDGLFAFSSAPVAVGDSVLVTGRAIEFNGLTELSPVTVVDVCGSGTIDAAAYDLPRMPGTTFEPVENVLLTFPEPLSATEHFQLGRFGEVTVSSEGRLFQPTERVAPGAPAAALLEESNRRRLLIDDGSTVQNPASIPFLTPQPVRIGDAATGVTGVLSFGFGLYRLQPTEEIEFDRTNPRPESPGDVGGELRVASFNTLNYFTTLVSQNPNARGANNATEFARQQAKEVAAITGLDADVIGLMEVENNGETAIGSLVDALNAATAPGTYAYISEPAINPPNEFGGTFGTDAIKVALIYRPAAATPVGAAQTSADAIFDRPPLIQSFRPAPGGESFTVVVNHFKSKNCTDATGLDLDQGDGQSCFNARRVAQATELAEVLDGLGVPNPLIVGDLNSYSREDPIGVLEDAGYSGLSELHEPDARRYSFVFDGFSGELDHAMARAGLLDNVTGASIWHINADEPLILDYNTEFNPPALYAPDAHRSSDHDPLVLGLEFNEAPTADAGGPYEVDEGGTAQLSATASDADNDTLTYAWDLDGDGTFETTGQTVTYTAGDGPATRTVAVRVGDGTTSTQDEATVTIANVAPTATFVAPSTSFAGFPFTLSLAGATDPSAADTAAGFEFAFDCGDGAGYGPFGATSTASCPTSDVGARTVRGQVRDKDGGVTEYTGSVAVIVTFDSLCDLTQEYSSKPVVANALCALLERAEQTTNPTVREVLLIAYRILVAVSTGTRSSHAFTPTEGATLTRLSRAL